MALTLNEFIAKTRENEEKKVKVAEIQIKDFGTIEFQRPSVNDLLKFQKEMFASMKNVDFENEDKVNFDMSQIDMEKFAKIASEFLYKSCSFFKEKELRNIFPSVEFYDIPLNIFGSAEVIGIATDVFNSFNSKKEIKETIETIKN